MVGNTDVRPEWTFEVGAASQRFIGQMLMPWPRSIANATRGFLRDLPEPGSPAEQLVLRARLAHLSDNAAWSYHRMFHRVLQVPTCRMGFDECPRCPWSDATRSPHELFEAWALAYQTVFEANHHWPLSVRAAMLIERRCCLPFALPELVHRLACSRSTLTHTFADDMGLSAQEYHVRARIHSSFRMVRGAETKTDAVARLCGYAATKSFYRAFRLITGLTPGEAQGMSTEAAAELLRTKLALGAELRYSVA